MENISQADKKMLTAKRNKGALKIYNASLFKKYLDDMLLQVPGNISEEQKEEDIRFWIDHVNTGKKAVVTRIEDKSLKNYGDIMHAYMVFEQTTKRILDKHK